MDTDASSQTVSDFEILRAKLLDFCQLAERRRASGASEDAWFYFAAALGIQSALEEADKAEEFPGPDPINFALEGDKDRRIERLHQIFMTVGDMDFEDYLPQDLLDEFRAYCANRAALDQEAVNSSMKA